MGHHERQLTLFNKFAPEPIPPPEERAVPDVPVVDEHMWDLHRTYSQGAESNQNTQRHMMNRCLRATGGDVAAATELFRQRMEQSIRRRQRKQHDASTH